MKKEVKDTKFKKAALPKKRKVTHKQGKSRTTTSCIRGEPRTTTSCIRGKHEIDATGKAVGRLASQVAILLQGKNKPEFTPHIDSGDNVTVINAAKLKFTGKKLVQKDYYHHTMYPGGLRRTPMKKVFEKDPTEVVRRAVNGMLPKNKLRNERMKRLVVKP